MTEKEVLYLIYILDASRVHREIKVYFIGIYFLVK